MAAIHAHQYFPALNPPTLPSKDKFISWMAAWAVALVTLIMMRHDMASFGNGDGIYAVG